MKILVSKRATIDFHRIQEYLQSNWGGKSVERFKSTVSDFLNILERFPEIGSMQFPEKNIRGFQLTSQIRVFYTIKQSHIFILGFFDVRQNPNNKNL